MERKIINFVDIDDTTFKTKTNILVVDEDDNILKRLDPKAFDYYTLKPGESFDFSEFENSKIFFKTAKPIPNVIKIIENILNEIIELDNGSKLIFLTARSDMNDKRMFLETFLKHGIPVDNKDLIYIERAGNLLMKAHIAKYIIIKQYLDRNYYDLIRLIDDSDKNISEFLKLKKEYAESEFEILKVLKNGLTKKII